MRVVRLAAGLVSFAVFYLFELVAGSVRVAHDVLTPRDRMRPAILAFTTRARTDLELTVLSSLITLTPGTLCVAVAEDRRTLFVHAMFVDDGDGARVRSGFEEGLERRVLTLLRAFEGGGAR